MTLTWYDPPALLSAASQLVNDLDVSLRFLDGRGIVRPWLGGDDDGHDRVNTVEHIRVPVGQRGGAAWVQVSVPAYHCHHITRARTARVGQRCH